MSIHRPVALMAVALGFSGCGESEPTATAMESSRSAAAAQGLACPLDEVESVDVAPVYRLGSPTVRGALEEFTGKHTPTLRAEDFVRRPVDREETALPHSGRFVYRRDGGKLVDVTFERVRGLWSTHFHTACEEVTEGE